MKTCAITNAGRNRDNRARNQPADRPRQVCVDAIAVVPPYYYPHDDWEVYAHYKAIARAVPGTPMFIYYSHGPERGMDYARAVTAIRWGRIGHWIH